MEDAYFFNDSDTTEIYTLSLHDALPICDPARPRQCPLPQHAGPRVPEPGAGGGRSGRDPDRRSEEHTSELQSRENLVCRLLLEKKKKPPQRQPRRSPETKTGA